MNAEPDLLSITLFCNDVPRSITFYESLGIPFDSDLHGGVGSSMIGLHPASARWPTTRTALSLTVDDLSAVTAALDGIDAVWEPTPGTDGKVIGAYDPDGNRVLIAQRIDT